MIRKGIAVTACLAILATGCAAPKNYSPIKKLDRIEDIDAAMKQDGVVSLDEIKQGVLQARTYQLTPGRDAVLGGLGVVTGATVYGLEKIGLARPMSAGMKMATGYLTAWSAIETAIALASYEKNTIKATIKLPKVVEVRRYRSKQTTDLLTTILDATMSTQEKEGFLNPLKVCPWLYIMSGTIDPSNGKSYIYSSGQEDIGGGRVGSAAVSTVGNKVGLALKYGLEIKGRSQDNDMCDSDAAEKYFGDMIAVLTGKYKSSKQSVGLQMASVVTKEAKQSKQELPEPQRGDKRKGDAAATTAVNPSTSIEEQRAYERFVVSGDTVLDTETKLMWPLQDNGKDLNWREADRYCKGFRGGGHADWRMPSQSELQSLYDRTAPPQTVQCHTPLNILIAASPIQISCPWMWSTEINGDQAGGFLFDRGAKVWSNQYSTYGARVIPVRSAVK